MQDLNTFKLIDGIFTAEEATHVLTALINYKIDYHNREDFSNHIRFNKNPEHSNKRVAQLIESKKTIQDLLTLTNDKNFKLKIDGTVIITIEE